MCGRFVITSSLPSLLPDLFVGLSDPDISNDFNVAPTRNVPVVHRHDGRRQLDEVRWGLIPVWAKSFKQRPQPINARVETVAKSGMFRGPFQRGRAIVPALGYFEWTVLADGSKQPHFIFEPDGALAMAGILSRWPDPNKAEDDPDKWLTTMAILTRDAHFAPGEVHDRAPAMLTADAYDQWLDPDTETDTLLALLDRTSLDVAAGLRHYEVSKDVNAVRNNGPSMIEPLV